MPFLMTGQVVEHIPLAFLGKDSVLKSSFPNWWDQEKHLRPLLPVEEKKMPQMPATFSKKKSLFNFQINHFLLSRWVLG